MSIEDGAWRKAGKERITTKEAELKSGDHEKVGKQAKNIAIAKPACPRKKLKAPAWIPKCPTR